MYCQRTTTIVICAQETREHKAMSIPIMTARSCSSTTTPPYENSKPTTSLKRRTDVGFTHHNAVATSRTDKNCSPRIPTITSREHNRQMLCNNILTQTQPHPRRHARANDPARNTHLDETLHIPPRSSFSSTTSTQINTIYTEWQYCRRDKATIQIYANIREQGQRNGLFEPASAWSSVDDHLSTRRARH